MILPRLITSFLLTLCIATAAAQQGVEFSPAEWDFGAIREQDGPVSHTFTGVNRSDKPLVILDVVTSCGCTVPKFSREPVLPGGKTEITVTYDPANRPGSFTKELGVYSTERKKIATLKVLGSVTPRPKGIEELYPIDAGGGLRLNSALCAFSYIYPGVPAQSSVGFVNTLSRPVKLELRLQTGSGLLETSYPSLVGAGERGEINLAYAIPASDPHYGTLRDALEIAVDGRTNGTLLLVHAIGADDPSSMPKNRAPKAELSENIVKFGAVKRNGSLRHHRVTLSNTGSGELILRAVESKDPVATTFKAGQRIAPGGKLEGRITLDPSGEEYGTWTDQVLLVTNDPARPMRRLRVTAIIER